MGPRTFAGGVAVLAIGLSLTCAGCEDNFQYLIAERSGEVTVVIINDTPYRAALSFGVWDALDLSPPGQAEFQQLRLAPHSSSDDLTITCARNFAIGTSQLIDRLLAIDAVADQEDFDPDAFDTTVHFSDAPEDSDLAAVATVGFAAGIERLIGLHFTCEDRLVFTLLEDPSEPGGFRIDPTVIPDTQP